MAPDGTHFAVTSWTGHGLSTQIGQILVVSLPDRVAGAPVSLETDDPNAGFTAEAAAISQKGAIVIAGPSAKPSPVIYALGYADGEISLPDPEDTTTQLGAFQGQTGTYVALSPDGSLAVIPSGGSVLDTFLVGDNGQLAVGKEQISSGGNGAHSAVIAPDGKTVYVRNLLPPQDNIAVFQIGTNGDLKDTGLRLTCPGIPQAVIKFLGQAVVPAAGPQMVAVTPDGKKVYATNAYGGTPTAANLFLYGDGNVLVYNAGSAAPIKTLTFGKNPFAVAIQAK
jgi:DNA-binding beta-propeller fold protein YncE